MELIVIPIKVPMPTGDILYHGEDDLTLEAGRELLIKDSKGGAPVEHFKQTVPEGKVWSAHILLEIIETDA